MIRRIIINNIKKFGHQEFEIPDHLVIAGPNNSGKTTILQAIAAWSEIAVQWRHENPDLSRGQDGNYPAANLNVLNFNSIPLADFNHLWNDKDVTSPASISLHTDQWKIGFEILYKARELVTARPVKDVKEVDLDEYLDNPLIPVYIPPFSQLDRSESLFGPGVVPAQLAGGHGGRVLRNLLFAVYQDIQKWKKLQKVVRSFFGYELLPPTSGATILTQYRHSEKDEPYELNSAASGFLQILMVYASLLHEGVSVVLIDEPDAHLHILLQEKIYRDLRKYVRLNKLQLIIATHSGQIINAADEDSLRVLTGSGELKKVHDSKKVIATLRLESTEIALAITEPGILYVEGKTDIDILREWARILGHSLFAFLEKPFWYPTAEEKDKNRLAVRHFDAMRLIVSDFRGVELRDGDQRAGPGSLPKGMERLHWQRYEIESYLIHPETIIRFVKKNNGTSAAHRVDAYMKQQLPLALHEDPSETLAFLRQTKAKTILAPIMQEAGIQMKESDYYQIAAEMLKDEIHPEVLQKLDTIAEHFNIQS